MRRTRFLPALAVLCLLSCNENLIVTPGSEAYGEVMINLKSDEKVEIVSVRSGGVADLPDVGDFWIELVNSSNVKFRREKYSELDGKRIGMNSGEYTLMAKHGDSLGVGFDKPFYMAKQQFTVEPQKLVIVNAVAKLANVKLAVEYGSQIRQDYESFYTVVKNVDHKRTSLNFEMNETRPGYIPGGTLSVTVYAIVDGQLRCYTLKDENGEPAYIDAAPNDFITLSVNTGINYGSLALNVKIDNSVEEIEKEFVVPADAASNTLPSITLSSFDEDGNYYVLEGVQDAPSDLGFTYKAYSGIKRCEVSITSEYLAGLGVPSSIDLKNISESLKGSLENVGFFLAGNANVGVFGMEDMIHAYSKNSRYLGGGKPTEMGTFTLTLEDEASNVVTKTVKVLVKPDGNAIISYNDYDVWATKVVNPMVQVKKGNYALMTVQSSTDGNTWHDFKPVASSDFSLGEVAGLTPGTKYYLRVIYDGWIQVSDVAEIVTESPAQVGNAGFEDWSSSVFETNYDDITWYQPWISDQWWDTNATVTLRSSLTVGYLYFKSFPCVHYSVDSHSGNRSAQITCVNVGNENSEWWTNGGWRVGELFLGRGDGASNLNTFNRVTDGHAFGSRPSSMTFWYEYDPHSSSDTFSAEVIVKAQDGTVLATSRSTGSAKSSWTSMTLPLNYTVTNKKAATIHINFLASTSSSHTTSAEGFTLDGPYLEIAGERKTGDNYQIKLSATLRVDDVQLNY